VNTLFQLLADLIRMLLRFALRLMETLIGCAVRLLYWTVRTYGWGRTGGFLAALATSYMVFSRLVWRQWGITVSRGWLPPPALPSPPLTYKPSAPRVGCLRGEDPSISGRVIGGETIVP
jgi:hypothetical protein